MIDLNRVKPWARGEFADLSPAEDSVKPGCERGGNGLGKPPKTQAISNRQCLKCSACRIRCQTKNVRPDEKKSLSVSLKRSAARTVLYLFENWLTRQPFSMRRSLIIDRLLCVAGYYDE
jgi:NAD-dependent dihydropyrimidine dehydrogenase PreA subunit